MLQVIASNKNKFRIAQDSILLLFVVLFFASTVSAHAESEGLYTEEAGEYEKFLFLKDTKDEDGEKTKSSADIRHEHDVARHKRASFYKYVTVGSLAGAETGYENSEELLAASVELKSSADEAKTENERLAEVTRGHALILEALAQQNKLLSQLLFVKSMESVSGMPLGD